MGKLTVILAAMAAMGLSAGCAESTSSSGASMEVQGHHHGGGGKKTTVNVSGGGSTTTVVDRVEVTKTKEVLGPGKPRNEPPAWGRKWGPAQNGVDKTGRGKL